LKESYLNLRVQYPFLTSDNFPPVCIPQLIGDWTIIGTTPKTHDTHLIILSIINRISSSTAPFAPAVFVWLVEALKISDIAHALVSAQAVDGNANHCHCRAQPHTTPLQRPPRTQSPQRKPQTKKTPNPGDPNPTLSMQFPHKFVAAADPKSCAASVMSFNHNWFSVWARLPACHQCQPNRTCQTNYDDSQRVGPAGLFCSHSVLTVEFIFQTAKSCPALQLNTRLLTYSQAKSRDPKKKREQEKGVEACHKSQKFSTSFLLLRECMQIFPARENFYNGNAGFSLRLSALCAFNNC